MIVVIFVEIKKAGISKACRLKGVSESENTIQDHCDFEPSTWNWIVITRDGGVRELGIE